MGITVFLAPQRQATLMTLKTVNRILTLFVVFRDLKHLPIRGFCSYLGNYLSYNVEIWYGGCPIMRLSNGRMCGCRATHGVAMGPAMGQFLG